MQYRRRSLPGPARLLLATLLLAPPLALAGPASSALGSLARGEAPTGPLRVEGVVTGDFRAGLGGFYLQDAGDSDPATPDALLVQAGPELAVPPGFGPGMHCQASGELVELRAGADRLRALAAASIGPCRAAVPAEPVRVSALPSSWEPLEGMRVRIEAPLTVTGTHALERYGELTVSFAGRQWQPSEIALPGTPEHARLAAANARQRLLLDDGSGQRDPQSIPYLGEASTPRVGSIVQGVEGILERRHGSWRIQVEQPLQLQAAGRPQPPRVPGTLKVAAFNLENLFNGDGRGGGFPTKRGARTHAAMQAQLAKLVATVHGLDPDIAALMELENDGYGPESSIAQLVDALNADGAQWRFVDAGHGPGGDTIRVGLIYRADRVVARGEPAVLEGGPFGERSRVPLAQAFVRKGGKRDLVVVANHLKSKGCSEATGADADRGDGQGCWNALRTDSARRLHAWLKTHPVGSRAGRVVMLGDFNAYAMEDPLHWLRSEGGWVDAFAAAGIERPWSYVYDGLSGRLDHALLSPSLVPALRGAAEWHVNADEPDDAGYAGRNEPGPWRSSDHDPLLLGFDL
ncbi:Endonuclease/exonuclease/phosphatase [Pseudoxanthomonas suwonensis 11-1]|uniref:Endonuclease/exonuclease/phosphatase n=1 Tax=Pseudoxanthomonas suwonensis (strain 11-1) TaxID=743721 RepID=E6WP32_PSEUU|nr:ExeM/NucH family extracellular endonuclease [Pseudoxanthomonas suwonensis]ADV25931.1 Endonuclease/exonuclease/phosphatase [Pseudoxanthomonas suwonensis 11-1]